MFVAVVGPGSKIWDPGWIQYLKSYSLEMTYLHHVRILEV